MMLPADRMKLVFIGLFLIVFAIIGAQEIRTQEYQATKVEAFIDQGHRFTREDGDALTKRLENIEKLLTTHHCIR